MVQVWDRGWAWLLLEVQLRLQGCLLGNSHFPLKSEGEAECLAVFELPVLLEEPEPTGTCWRHRWMGACSHHLRRSQPQSKIFPESPSFWNCFAHICAVMLSSATTSPEGKKPLPETLTFVAWIWAAAAETVHTARTSTSSVGMESGTESAGVKTRLYTLRRDHKQCH